MLGLVETCRLNGVGAYEWLSDVFDQVVLHPDNRGILVWELLPWTRKKTRGLTARARTRSRQTSSSLIQGPARQASGYRRALTQRGGHPGPAPGLLLGEPGWHGERASALRDPAAVGLAVMLPRRPGLSPLHRNPAESWRSWRPGRQSDGVEVAGNLHVCWASSKEATIPGCGSSTRCRPHVALQARSSYEVPGSTLKLPQVIDVTDEAVLTIQEVAALLRISERTIYAMAKEGRLPGAVKVGGRWRVLRVKLMAWLEDHSGPVQAKGDDQDGGAA